MPDIETLMQEWSPEFEELLGKVRCALDEWLAQHMGWKPPSLLHLLLVLSVPGGPPDSRDEL